MNVEDMADKVINRLERELQDRDDLIIELNAALRELEKNQPDFLDSLHKHPGVTLVDELPEGVRPQIVLGEEWQKKHICIPIGFLVFLAQELFPKERHREIIERFIKIEKGDALFFSTQEEGDAYKEMLGWIEND